jgi:hypothetical protein
MGLLWLYLLALARLLLFELEPIQQGLIPPQERMFQWLSFLLT